MKKLTDKVTFRSGVEISNRMVLSPMLTLSGNKGGFASEDTLRYYRARSKAAGLLITEYHYVSEDGGPSSRLGYPEQLGIQDDAHLDSIKNIAQALKKDGNKAILQINHGGREARIRATRGQDVYAPSKIDFSFLPFEVKEMSDSQIKRIITDFGKATKRAIDAGFDGVEIHGANHYLLQQFFSTLSNQRTDEWGGSLEKRMAFPLAVVREVKRVVEKYAPKNFIVGYRISPEEIHGADIGYTYKESRQLVQKIAENQLDYIHLSLWDGYNSTPKDCKESYAKLFKEVLDEQTKLLIVGNVFTKQAAQDAVENYSDLIAIGRETIIDPLFGDKIMRGKGDTIVSQISPEQLKYSQMTQGMLEAFTSEKGSLQPLPNGESIRKFHTGKFDI